MSFPPRPRRLITAGVLAAVLGSALVPTAAMAAAPAAPAATTDFTDYVNSFVSTEDDFGQDLPGAEAPNSLVKINPMTVSGRSHSGYDYAEDQIAGFTHTNLDGVGGSGGGGDLLVVPTYTAYTSRPSTDTYAKDYSHDAEEAEPGYYGVELGTDRGAILAEATTDVRTGQDRFTFPEAGTASLVVDLRNNFTQRKGATLDYQKLPDGRVSLSGGFTGHFNGYDYTMHYYVETTAPVASVRTWGGSGALGTTAHQDGADIGAVLEFDVEADQEVGLRVAVSPISAAQAKTDLAAEMGDRGFEQVRQDTSDAWNEILGRLAVTASATSDPDGELQTLFYTHLYRMFGMPANATSTSGTYRGLDGEVHEADGYTHYDGWGFWDDFRKYEILAIGYPEVFRDIAQSIVDLYATFASTGKGSLSNVVHSVPTVRFERAAVVVADAVAKGAELRGLADAWPALVSQAQGGYANADNVKRGYIANEVDDTLGTAYDDWAMATIAEALGKTAEAEAYRLRAANWTNLYREDAVTLADGSTSGLVFPKNADGAWANVDPESFEAGNVYQGTLWQYNWYAADDMGGMIQLMGGEEKTLSALSFMFGEHAPDDGSRMLHANANEIDLQAPYLFNYVGAPSKTQYWVRSIYTKETWNRYIATGSTNEVPSRGGEFSPPVKTKVFKNSPQGFLPTMDNDTGTMSSTFVAAALGLFPVLAGSDEYQIGTPFFENVRISYESGRTFDITANGVSADDFYIQSATLNGQDFDRTWITYDQLTAGGRLSFDMGGTASDWAEEGVASSSLSDEVPSSIYEPTSAISIGSKVFAESDAGDGSIGNGIPLTLANGTFAGRNGDDLAASGAISAENVPAGLTLVAERTGDRSVLLTLEGRAERSGTMDSIDDLQLAIADDAFRKKPSTGTRTFALQVVFDGVTLRADRTRVVSAPDGTIDATVALTLSGAAFAGTSGRDLVADGALTLPGLPDGVAATGVKRDDATVEVHLTGSLGEAQRASFSLAFTDSAITGAPASSIRGDGVSGLGTLELVVDRQRRAQLEALLAEAELVVKGAYTASSFAAFSAARDEARAVLADTGSTDEQLESALKALTKAGAALAIAETPYRVLEAEDFDASSGGRLNPETTADSAGGTVGNIGGVTVGSWISYEGIDFAGALPVRVKLRYANHPADTAKDEYVEVRVGAVDGPVAAKIDVQTTDGWNSFATAEAVIEHPELLAGSNTIYFVFGGTPDPAAANSWVVNLDWAQFLKTTEDEVVVDPVRVQAEDASTTSGGSLIKEGTSPSGNIGGTYDGGELTYQDVDFGAGELATITVRSSTRDERVGADPRLEFYLDEKSEENRVGTVQLPKTGGWGNYVVTTADLDRPVTGTHTLIVVMRVDAVAGQEFNYVSNLDWFEFAPVAVEQPPVDLGALQAAVADAQALAAHEDRYLAVDFAVFRAALDRAARVAEASGATQDEVDEALRILTLAADQLEWKAVRLLPVLLDRAAAVDRDAYTPETVAALDAAVEVATAVQDGASYEEYAAAVAGLEKALDGLAEPGEEPGTGEPGTGEPGTGEPGTGEPGTGEPGAEQPSGTPDAPVEDGAELPEGLRDLISATVSGRWVTVTGLGASVWHFGYVYSEPTALGWAQTDASGVATLALPDGLAPGTHRLAMLDADGELVGWTEITIAASSGGSDDLAVTGADGAVWWTVGGLGALLLALGAVLLIIRRRVRS
ncbi:glycoside hydrolase domain-containing protein [Microbacterium tumbae]